MLAKHGADQRGKRPGRRQDKERLMMIWLAC